MADRREHGVPCLSAHTRSRSPSPALPRTQPLLSRVGAPRPLPPFAIERLASVQTSSLSGLFVDIHRAWVTFDDELLLWNYEEPGGGYADYG
jgi:hypothetical protein